MNLNVPHIVLSFVGAYEWYVCIVFLKDIYVLILKPQVCEPRPDIAF